MVQMLSDGLKIRTEGLEFESFASNCFSNRYFYGWKRFSAFYSTLLIKKKESPFNKKGRV
jgi:hypothetical protein